MQGQLLGPLQLLRLPALPPSVARSLSWLRSTSSVQVYFLPLSAVPHPHSCVRFGYSSWFGLFLPRGLHKAQTGRDFRQSRVKPGWARMGSAKSLPLPQPCFPVCTESLSQPQSLQPHTISNLPLLQSPFGIKEVELLPSEPSMWLASVFKDSQVASCHLKALPASCHCSGPSRLP